VVVFGLAVCFVLAFSLLGWVGVYVCFSVMLWGINGFSNAKLFSTMLKFC